MTDTDRIDLAEALRDLESARLKLEQVLPQTRSLERIPLDVALTNILAAIGQLEDIK